MSAQNLKDAGSVEKAKVSEEEIQHNLDFQKDETKEPELTVPGTGEVQAKMEDPVNLSPKQWAEEIISPLWLLKGWCMHGDEPKVAPNRAFELNRKDAKPDFQTKRTSLIEASMVYTERSRKFIRSGFNKQKATATYNFVSASVEHAHRERSESQNEQRTLYITGNWNVNAVTLTFAKGEEPYKIRPTPAFNRAVDRALEGDTLSDRYFNLCQVFKEYGQIFASQVTLGGKLFFTDEKSYQSTMNEREEENTVKTAVSVKVGKFAGEAGAEWSEGTKEFEKDVRKYEKKTFNAIGGEPGQAQKPDKWLESLAPHNNWVPISLDVVVPIYDLLDDERKKKVENVLAFVMDDPPMRLRRFIKDDTKDDKGKPVLAKHRAACTLKVPTGYKIISGGARVIDPRPSEITIGNMLWASYPTKVDGQDAWRAESWDCKVSRLAHIEISVIALYDPYDEWNVKVFHNESESAKQGHAISVAVDPGYYLTGGGAEVFDSTGLNKRKEEDQVTYSFLVASYPDIWKEGTCWAAISHDHLYKDFHRLRVYAIGVQPKESDQLLDIGYWPKASGEVEEHYPVAEAKPEENYKDYVLVGGGAEVNKEVDHHLLASYPFTTSDAWRASGWKAHSIDHENPQTAILTAYAIGVKGAIFEEDLPEA